MPKDPDSRPLSQTEKSDVYIASLGEFLVMPQDPDLLRAIIRALLMRIRHQSTKEAAQLGCTIRYLAGVENYNSTLNNPPLGKDMDRMMDCLAQGEQGIEQGQPEARPSEIFKHMVIQLVLLANEPVGPEGHWPGTIALQHNILAEYLKQKDFQAIRHRGGKLRWLNERRKHMLQIVGFMPCPCTDSFALPPIGDRLTLADTILQQAWEARAFLTMAGIIEDVLMVLHKNLGAANIEKLRDAAKKFAVSS